MLVLTSSMNDPDWPDALDRETGVFTYYGDNKKPGRELHDTGRDGNLILQKIFAATRSGQKARCEALQYSSLPEPHSLYVHSRLSIESSKRAIMADQIVITEKSSQAKDVRAAVGSRYGEILPAEGHLFDLLEPEDVVPAWNAGRRSCCDPKVFTALARRKAVTKPPSSEPFARHYASPGEFGSPQTATAKGS